MVKDQPLISVIVPVYNVEKYLTKCLDSILSQTYKNLEIILIDDGSTDKSGQMIDSYSKKYKNIKALHKRNGGLSSARNTGIKHAKGEWLVFIDSDDYIKNNFVARLFELASSNDADIATCSFESFSDDNSMLKKSPIWPTQALTGIEAVNDMLKNKRPAYVCLSMFRAELFKTNHIEFPVGQEYEDMAPRIKLLYYAKKVAFTNDKLYFYLIRKSSITGKKFSVSRYQDFLKALNSIKEFLENSKSAIKIKFLDYFEFYSLVTLLNYLAKERKPNVGTKKYWRKIRGQLKTLYSRVEFPSVKNKLLYRVLLLLSANRTLYSIIYRRAKK